MTEQNAERSLPDPYPVPSDKVARGTAQVPASKSLAHRGLICAALGEGNSLVGPIPAAEDVAATVACLRAMGVDTREHESGSGERDGGTGAWASVKGAAGALAPPRQPLDCGASGTTLRLLMGVCGATPGTFTLDGADQLRRRPVGDMEEPLTALGARVRYAEREGHPPVVVEGARWRGGTVEVRSAISSQFLSGLLLGTPLAQGEVVLRSPGLVSAPYAEMTAAVMARFGVEVGRPAEDRWLVAPGRYRATRFTVEPDASGAAFLWAAAAATGGEVTVAGTGGASLQGDAVLPQLLLDMGCKVGLTSAGTRVSGPILRGLEADLTHTPDLLPALVAVAAFAPEASTFRGIGHLRFKESDRLAVLADALTALGAQVYLEADRMTLVPAEDYTGGLLDPAGDHRMAMAFTVLGLRVPGVRISQPSCVAKSFPNFFEVLESLLS
jgi:3-phosphoshikimate 1-carboxyvinyltransferase